jgi:WD40 repeat protein
MLQDYYFMSWDGYVHAYKADEGKSVMTLLPEKTPNAKTPQSLWLTCLHSDGFNIVGGGSMNSAFMWDGRTGQCVLSFEGHKVRDTPDVSSLSAFLIASTSTLRGG